MLFFCHLRVCNLKKVEMANIENDFFDEEELKRLLRERLKSIAEGTAKFISHEEVVREMEALLREAESDFQNGRFESHSSICKRYGVLKRIKSFIFAPTKTFRTMTLNVYEQYFAAQAEFNGVPRHAALVMLIADSEAGQIRYEAAVSFFPHNDEEDFAVSYDAYFSKVVYENKGRRSKKREQLLLNELRDRIDEMAKEAGGEVFWDQPLCEARRS